MDFLVYKLEDYDITNMKSKAIIKNKRINIEIHKEDNNKLEAIVINTTRNEFKNGRLITFLEVLDNNTVENIHNIPFYILFNNIDEEEIDDLYNIILKYNNLHKYITKNNIISLDIPKHLDIYFTNNIPIKRLYGNKSGPNYCFFKTLKIFADKDTILNLESDCYINSSNWLNIAYNYVLNNKFLISGSIYKGLRFIPNNFVNHINGVAFYRTGSNNFKIFINQFHRYFINIVRKQFGLPYDVAIQLYIDKLRLLGSVKKNKIIQFYYRFIKSHILDNNLICNTSNKTFVDTNIDIDTINIIYNDPIIIHTKKKFNQL